MKILKKFREKRRLRKLIKEANHQKLITGKQYFVVPVVTRGVKNFMLMSNDLHKRYNKKAKSMKKNKISYPELLKMAVYKTKEGEL